MTKVTTSILSDQLQFTSDIHDEFSEGQKQQYL